MTICSQSCIKETALREKENHFHCLLPIAWPNDLTNNLIIYPSSTWDGAEHTKIANQIFVDNLYKWLWKELKILHIKFILLQLISYLVNYLGGKERQ